MLFCKNKKIIEGEIRKPNKDEVAFIHLQSNFEKEIENVVGDVLKCHELVVLDCKQKGQRPHLDVYDTHLYLPFYILGDEYQLYETGIVMGENFVVMVLSKDTPFLEEIIMRIKQNPANMKNSAILLYTILDVILKKYRNLIDLVEDTVDDMEDKIQENSEDSSIMQEIFTIKRKIHKIRRIFVEERNVLDYLRSCESLIQEREMRYFADAAEQANRIIEEVDTFRDALMGLHDLKINNRADHMNDIMKKLTVVNTIFLPLAFIVGLYGTNIHLPLYQWKYNYLVLWGLLLTAAIGTFFFMKKKKYF